MYVATRGLYRMAPPTIIVPTVIKECVEKLFEAHRAMDHSELKHNLIGLNVGNILYTRANIAFCAPFFWNLLGLNFRHVIFAGEEFQLRKDLKVRAFRTYHGIPSQVTY